MPPSAPAGLGYGSPGGYGPPPRTPQQKPRLITPAVAVILIGAIAVIGGLVWFGISKNSGDESASSGSNGTIIDGTIVPGQPSATTDPKAPTATTVPVTGNQEMFCPLEESFHQAVGLYDQATTAPTTDVSAGFARQAAPLLGILMKAAPNAELYGQMHDLWYDADNMSRMTVQEEIDDAASGMGSLTLGEIRKHYRAGIGPMAGSDLVVSVQAYFDGCG